MTQDSTELRVQVAATSDQEVDTLQHELVREDKGESEQL